MLSNAVLRCKLMLKRVFIGCTERIRKCRYLSVIWTLFPVIVGLPFSGWVLAASVPAILKRIDIVYYIDFPWHKKYRVNIAKGCHRFFLHSGSAVLRCEENMSLLRPLHMIKAWQRQQSKMGFLPLTIKEFGIKNVHGHIKKIKSISLYALPVHGQKTKFMTVTGMFIRHVNDVRKYHFRNRATGRISSIWSTPNHPFYLKNRGAFVPVEEISPEDEMIQKDGQIVKMNCPVVNGKCGNQSKDSIVPVYNLEIAQKHTYFVGKDFLLVHNPYDPVTGKRMVLQAWERYKLFVDFGCINQVFDPYNKGAITFEFRLNLKARDEFLSKFGFSNAKKLQDRQRAAISGPLRILGFESWSQNVEGRRDLVWILKDRKRFADAIKDADIDFPVPPPIPLEVPSELPSSDAPRLSHFDFPSSNAPKLSHFNSPDFSFSAPASACPELFDPSVLSSDHNSYAGLPPSAYFPSSQPSPSSLPPIIPFLLPGFDSVGN